MKHVIQHNLDLTQSKKVAERAMVEYGKRFAKYDPTLEWLDDHRAEVSFNAKGMSITGTIELKPGAVEIDLEVPLVLRVFRTPAIKILDDEIRRLITENGAQA